MANGWREQIDDHHRRKEEEEARKEKKKEEKREAKLMRQAEREWAKGQRRLAYHKALFRCNVCGKPSNGPWEHTPSSSDPAPESYQPGESHCKRTYTYWDVPTGLKKCDRCGKWACKEHIYHGICQKCATKL